MAEKKTLDPAALTLQEAAKMLGLRREWLEEDIAAGAPTGADGTVNLVHYGAWLNAACEQSEQTRREPEGRVPKGCDAEGAHNLRMREGADGEA